MTAHVTINSVEAFQDARRKLAAVRELCAHEMERTDRTSASTYTDGIKVGQAAMAEAVLALLGGEATT